jgi:hypothetical protein
MGKESLKIADGTVSLREGDGIKCPTRGYSLGKEEDSWLSLRQKDCDIVQAKALCMMHFEERREMRELMWPQLLQ